MVELGSPDLSLRLEGIHEVLGPVHVVARGGLVILHDSVGSKQVVQEVDRHRGHHQKSEGELSARGNVTADSRTLVRVQDGLLEALHGLDWGELAIGD